MRGNIVNMLTVGFATLAIGSSFLFGTGANESIHLSNTSVPAQIQVIAKAMDEPAQYYVELAQVESSTNPMATNPRSSAVGLYQFINSTWRTIVREYGKQYQLTYDGRTDVRQSVVAAILFTRDNSAYLEERLDRPATNKELYLAHFLGRNGAAELLTAEPNEPVVDVVGNHVVRANPSLKGKTVGQAIKILTRGIS